MRRSLPLGLALAAGLLVSFAAPQKAHAELAGPLAKLTRGAVNTVTGWVEIPKRMHETWKASGAGAGLTYGLIRGVGYGFVRTAAGVYELVTFPFPAPPDYAPVIQPEFVFDDADTDQNL